MATVADILATVRLNLDTGTFEVQALKVADSAGDKMANRLTSKIRGGLEEIGKGMAIGAGIAAFNAITGAVDKLASAIPNLIAQGQTYATTVHDIQEVTGGSAASTSIFVGTLESLGIATGGIETKFGMLATQVQTNTKFFEKYGIATRDAAGVSLDMVTILDNSRRVLGAMTSETERAYVARKLFGRTALEFIDYFRLADPQVQALTQRLVQYGLVLSQDTVDSAKESIFQQKQLDLAFTGLGVTLFTVVGPIVRTTMDSIAKWIAENGATIKATIAEIAAALSGLISGLTGLDMSGMSTFGASLMELGGEHGRVDELNQQLGTNEEALAAAQTAYDKATKATKANTVAVDAQIVAVDKETKAVDKRETAQEAAYEKSMGRLGAQLDAQLALLDAAERAAALATRDRDAQVALAAAYEDLRRAQTGGRDGTVDRSAEVKAQQDIATAKAQIAGNVIADAEAKRRTDIENTKAYVESVVALVKDATNRKALATTLGKRQTSLEASLAAAKERGDIEAVTLISTKLEAVKTTEARNQAAIRNANQKTELEKTKSQLEELKKSITDAFAATDPAVEAARAALVKAQQSVDDVNTALASLTEHQTLRNSLTNGAGGKPKLGPPLGASGSVAAGFAAVAAEWKKTGADMVATVQLIIDKVGELGQGVTNLANGFRYLTDEKYRNYVNDLANKAGMSNPWDALMNQIFGDKPKLRPGAGSPAEGGGFATGGYMPAGMSAWVGEAGRERATTLPGGGAWITPTGGGSGGVPPHSHDIVVDGQRLAATLDTALTYRPRR